MMKEQKKLTDSLRKQREKEWRENTRAKLMKKATRYEMAVYKALPLWVKKGARRQREFHHDGHTYFFDIYLPIAKVAIEVDGGYHATRRNKDVVRDAVASQYRIKTFRITNEDVMKASTLCRFVYNIERYCKQYAYLNGKKL